MKNGKNLLAAAVAIVLLLSLTACAVTPPSTTPPGSTPNPSTALPGESTSDGSTTAPSESTPGGFATVPSQSVPAPTETAPIIGSGSFEIPEGWIWNANSQLEGALAKHGYYYLSKGFLTYMDLASGQSVALCLLPGCAHRDSNCDAYLSLYPSKLFFTQDHLYYIPEDGALRRRSAIGTEEVTVGVPGASFLKSGATVQLNELVVTGEYLYYRAEVTGAKNGGETHSVWYLGRFHLNTGKDEILLQQEITDGWSFQSMKLCAAQEGGMLFYQSEGIPVKSDDPELVEKSRAMKVSLKQWDAATGKVTTLMEKTRQDFLEVYLVADNIVCFGGMDNPATKIRPNTMTYDLTTGEERIFREQAHFRGLGGGYGVLIQDDGSCILNLKTGETAAITGVRSPVIKAISPAGMVVLTAITDKDGQIAGGELMRCYVPYSALADGLTESDLLRVDS